MFHDFSASSKSLMRGIILCKQCCNSVSSIMIGYRICVQKIYDHIS